MPDDVTEIAAPPFDSISALHFSPTNSDHLLVSSWDAAVRYYDVASNEQKAKFDHKAAVLSCCFADASRAYSGGLDTTVRDLEIETQKITPLGDHGDAISAMNFSRDQNALITGSWDRTIRFWDPRAAPNAQQSSHSLPERVYYMDMTGNTLVVAMASRLFHVYDVRKMGGQPEQSRESSLKFMTRSLACMADGKGYATASVEGRIAVEYFDEDMQEKKYAFKCHRQTIDDVDHVWPVNALAFHPIYNTFASAGSDCTVSLWDHKVKKRLRQLPKTPAPVSALAFSADGAKLAIGASYTWDDGEEGAKTAGKPWIGVRKLGDEVKPKGWTGN